MRIALGCMGMSGVYGKTDDAQSVAVLHAAIERGITFFDTGDFYGSGHNELLIGKAIAGRRDQVQLSVKFGVLNGPGGWKIVDVEVSGVWLAITQQQDFVSTIDNAGGNVDALIAQLEKQVQQQNGARSN